MLNVQILVGTTSGNTEFLADHAADSLKNEHLECTLHYEPDIKEIDSNQPWLVFLASHGAGDYADSMLDFYDQLEEQQDPVTDAFIVVAIGESCYDTFCQAGRDLDQRLEQLGGHRLSPRVEIDMLEQDPEAVVNEQLPTWINTLRSYTQK